MNWHNLIDAGIVHRLGWALVHSLWQGAAVASMLGVILFTLRRASPQKRYLAATLSLALLLIAPVVTFALLQAPPRMPAPTAAAPPPSAGFIAADVRTVASPAAAPTTSRDAGIPRNDAPIPMAAAPNWSQRLTRLGSAMEPLLPRLVSLWGLGVLLLGLWHTGGWIAAQRLKFLATRPAGEVAEALALRLAERMQLTRPARILRSLLVHTPMVIGWWRPVILLPAAILTELSPVQLEAILAHELAHIRRHDYLVNLLQGLVETLLFYHPAVWWISRRIRIEREHCCDDIAAAVCGDRVEYARALTAVEELRSLLPLPAMTARGTASEGGREFLHRIRRILGLADRSPTIGVRSIAAVVAVVALLATATTLHMLAKAPGNKAVGDVTADWRVIRELAKEADPLPVATSGAGKLRLTQTDVNGAETVRLVKFRFKDGRMAFDLFDPANSRQRVQAYTWDGTQATDYFPKSNVATTYTTNYYGGQAGYDGRAEYYNMVWGFPLAWLLERSAERATPETLARVGALSDDRREIVLDQGPEHHRFVIEGRNHPRLVEFEFRQLGEVTEHFTNRWSEHEGNYRIASALREQIVQPGKAGQRTRRTKVEMLEFRPGEDTPDRMFSREGMELPKDVRMLTPKPGDHASTVPTSGLGVLRLVSAAQGKFGWQTQSNRDIHMVVQRAVVAEGGPERRIEDQGDILSARTTAGDGHELIVSLRELVQLPESKDGRAMIIASIARTAQPVPRIMSARMNLPARGVWRQVIPTGTGRDGEISITAEPSTILRAELTEEGRLVRTIHVTIRAMDPDDSAKPPPLTLDALPVPGVNDAAPVEMMFVTPPANARGDRSQPIRFRPDADSMGKASPFRFEFKSHRWRATGWTGVAGQFAVEDPDGRTLFGVATLESSDSHLLLQISAAGVRRSIVLPRDEESFLHVAGREYLLWFPTEYRSEPAGSPKLPPQATNKAYIHIYSEEKPAAATDASTSSR